MKTRLVYIGDDKTFQETLRAAAMAMGYPWLCVLDAGEPTADTEPSVQTENLLQLVFCDNPLGPTAPGRLTGAAAGPLILVCPAGGDVEQTHPTDSDRWMLDTIVKPLTPARLIQKIRLYEKVCTAYGLDPDPAAAEDSPAPEQGISRRIGMLRQHLRQADAQLAIQGDILHTLQQAGTLARRINCLDLESIATVCIEEIPRLIAGRFASLYRYDAGKKVLHLLRHNHPYPIERLVVMSEHADSPMATAIRQKELLVLKDLATWANGRDQPVLRLFAGNYRSNSCVIAPLLSGEQVLGVLNLADKIDGPYFDRARDLLPIQMLCNVIGSAMSNIQMYDEVRRRARTDSMTNLFNHRAFYDELEKEVRRNRRYGGQLSLIMIDLDNLKCTNDEHGHRAGDAIILHAAEQIRRCTREFDIAARYGGDEFAIILPNTSRQEAVIVARRLVQTVSARPVRAGSSRVDASVSVGVGQYAGGGIEEFMNEVDAALFAAKSAGKNRIQAVDTPAK
ncbi:MAG: GGDEF domain-containing protein [Sedimentisphaerales bacterium]|nr:GGDEF domain-containing protein [Sedimentisphaerales bacterium]